MARKYSYRRKKRTYHKRKNNNYDVTNLLAVAITLSIFWLFGIYKLYIEPNLDGIILFLEILVPFLILSLWIIFYYFYKKNKLKEKERIEKTPEFLLNLKKDINSFKPIRKYNKEELYQAELTWYLKNNYSNLDIEETRDYSRPDIVINDSIVWDIAIEIKWPTNMSWLKTIPDKINKYLPKWDYLFIVLFDINISENKNLEENMRIYNEKKQEIIENIIEYKKDKVFFIEIN